MPKTLIERINNDIFEILIRNYVLTMRDILTKFTQVYFIEDKITKNTLLLYFHHFTCCNLYNNTQNNTHRFTPYELVFEHTSSRLLETATQNYHFIIVVALEGTKTQKEKAKIGFDRKVSQHPYKIKIDDKVYVKE